MAEHPRITVDPKVMVGKPVIRGTRITVELVIGLLAQEWTEQDILVAYPHLTREDILACLAYAQDPVSSEKYIRSSPRDALSCDEKRCCREEMLQRRDIAVALCDRRTYIAHT